MPFKIRLGKRSQQYNVSSKDLFVVPIELLDQSVIECTLLATTTGHECLLNVSQRLGLLDSKYFGLLCISRRNMFQWIDLDKPVKKQLERFSDSFRLFLRVQYYVPAVEMIADEVSRSHYYLQLKTQIIDERIKCSREDAIRLASYALQSEFGDYDPDRHSLEILSNYALLPRSIASSPRERDILLETAIAGFKNLQGVQPTVAQVVYITEAQQLVGYGQAGFPCRDLESGADVCLGVSLQGIFALKAVGMDLSIYPWTDIANLIHHKKQYTIELNDGSRKNFLMADGDQARFAWQVCVKQHQYFLKTGPKSSGEPALDSMVNAQEPEVNGNTSYAQSPTIHSDFSSNHHHMEENGNAVHYEELSTYKPEQQQQHATNQMQQEVLPAKTVSVVPSTTSIKETTSQHHYEMTNKNNNESLPYMSMNGTYSNITTVQVHHEPPWVQSSTLINRNEPEMPSVQERKANLPPYQEPPSYEVFMKEKRTFQNISVNNVSYANVAPAMQTVDQKEIPAYSNQPARAPQYYVNKRSFAVMQPFPEIAVAGPRLSLPHPNGHYVPITSCAPMANPFTNSSPDLHSVSFGLRTMQPPIQAAYRQNLPMSYYTSVPDLSAQLVQPRSLDPRLLLVRPSNPQFPVVQQNNDPSGKFAIGSSEPSIPNATYSLYYNNQVSTPQPVQFKTASRHLSIDTLNHVKQANGGMYHFSPFENQVREQYQLRRPLNAFTIRESARENQLASIPSTRQEQQINGFSATRRRSHEENVYENIQELRATLQNELEREQQLEQQKQKEIQQQQQEPVVKEVAQETVLVNHSDPPHSSKHHSERVSETTTSRNEVLEKSAECFRKKKDTPRSENSMSDNSILNMSTMSSASTASKDPRIAALETKIEDPDFMRDFELLPRMNPAAKFTTALLPENIPRNRFRDILPYEENRIRLPPTKENRTGYINASNVTMTFGKLQQRYVAAQGPLAHTVVDFWQMVWSCNVNLIVMVTEFSEEGQEKCFTYYPQSSESENSVLRFGDFRVKCNFIIESSTYITSSLTLSLHEDSITVWHIRYTDWPDHTCPQDVQGFLSFLEGVDAIYRLSMRDGSSMTLKKNKKKKDNQQQVSPILVHCSAGVGRSGVVILCDALLRSLDTSKEVDVPKSLTQLRFQRMISVQNFGQYKFVYRVLALCLRNSRLI